MPSKRCHIITSYPCQAICQRPCRSCNFKPQASSNSSAIPDVKFSRPLLLHACIPQISFGVPQNQKSQSNQHIHLKSAKSNRKKAEVIHFHPILCMPAPSIIRSQRESKYESIVQEAEEKVEMSGDKWEKRNRLITNFWVAKPKKLATRRCFYEIRVIESKSKTKPSIVQGKRNKLFRKQRVPLPQSQTPDWFSLQFSCDPVSKDKRNSKFADATPIWSKENRKIEAWPKAQRSSRSCGCVRMRDYWLEIHL